MRGWRPAFCLLFALAACAEVAPVRHLALEPAGFGDLPGWANDRQSEALPAFARSCAVLMKKPAGTALSVGGTPRDWQAACAAIAGVPPGDDKAARAYFESYFTPYAASDGSVSDGLFTGYYEAELQGSPQQTLHYHVPLYARPADLIKVDLGLFKSDLKGQTIVGKVDRAALVPYDDRATIAANGLADRATVLLWVDDPVDAFFLEIQGSGRVKLADGTTMRVGYDGSNGRAYTAIGRVLADGNDIEKPVTMQKIRAWLSAHPDRAADIMNRNASYIFFRKLGNDTDGPIGAEGVAITPLRSMAVDAAFVPLGVPLWLDTQDPAGAPMRRLLIAQDTGGAIKGPVRGDVFWGAGAEAERMAGAMQSRGRYFLLLPKTAVYAGQ